MQSALPDSRGSGHPFPRTNPSRRLGQRSFSLAGGGHFTEQITEPGCKLAACEGLFCPSTGHREQREHGGELGSAQVWGTSPPASLRNSPRKGREEPPRLSPRWHNSLPCSSPAIGAAGHCKAPICRSSPAAPPRHISCSRQGWRAGSGCRAGKFLCIQSFYSIKISGSYSATSPLYCPGGLSGCRQTSPPPPQFPTSCLQRVSQPARSTWEETPSPGSCTRAPGGCSVPGPPPCLRSAAGADSFKELFIDTETSVFFPVDKTFSCGPLKK